MRAIQANIHGQGERLNRSCDLIRQIHYRLDRVFAIVELIGDWDASELAISYSAALPRIVPSRLDMVESDLTTHLEQAISIDSIPTSDAEAALRFCRTLATMLAGLAMQVSP